MPTLDFKGKTIIWSHHLTVPYHTFEEVPELEFNLGNSNENMIIEGDNLLALKALLPQYSGRIKLIYIDPPYNTGVNNGIWIYSDNVNSPLFSSWFKKVIDKTDLARHDKWLCMMVPRLRLLRELLSDDGIIFISIDDHELSNLRVICDQIFLEENRVDRGALVWENKGSTKGFSKIVKNHEYILAYAKDISKIKSLYGLNYPDELTPIDERLIIKRSDRNPPVTITFPKGLRIEGEQNIIFEGSVADGTNQVDIISNDGKLVFEEGKLKYDTELYASWPYKEEMKEFLLKIGTEEKTYDTKNQEWEEVYFTSTGVPYHKKKRKILVLSSILDDVGNSGSPDIADLEIEFDNPKPVKLITKLLDYFSTDGDIILDSFAGSGTTGHAVLQLEKDNRGNRKFILVQMKEDTEQEPEKNICKDKTRERIFRAIRKYGYNHGFRYLRIGRPIDAESMLNGDLPEYNQFAKYIYYLCTGDTLLDESKINEETFYVGEKDNFIINLLYKKDFDVLSELALTHEIAEKITSEHHNKKNIIYAPACFLDQDYLEEKQIEFVSIPYNIFERNQR